MKKLFAKFANAISSAAGHPATFVVAVTVVVIWAVCGPLFGYSETWQLVINTGTTIVTFLMVFVIQNAQNRDGAAIQAKLDELIRSSAAQNTFIGIEHLSQDEVEGFRNKCEAAAKSADRAVDKAGRKAIAQQTRQRAHNPGERREFAAGQCQIIRLSAREDSERLT